MEKGVPTSTGTQESTHPLAPTFPRHRLGMAGSCLSLLHS